MTYPFKIKLDRSCWSNLIDIIEWCNWNFGKGGHPSIGDTWTLDTAFGYSTFSFKNPIDAEVFALKWL